MHHLQNQSITIDHLALKKMSDCHLVGRSVGLSVIISNILKEREVTLPCLLSGRSEMVASRCQTIMSRITSSSTRGKQLDVDKD